MNTDTNIVIADESALFFYMHISSPRQIGAMPTWDTPLSKSLVGPPDFSSFNANHPLYGGVPIVVLVGAKDARRRTRRVVCRACFPDLPLGSFLKIREGLYVVSPELAFARMGNHMSEFQLAEVGMNLCGRYYINHDSGKINDRADYIATPERLGEFLTQMPSFRGSRKASAALRWVTPNSGSPAETKMKLQYCTPFWAGGLALPFTHMNFDVKSGKLSSLLTQDDFCIDLVNPELKVGMEYDGENSHLDASKDKRRLNELRTLGYELFPIDRSILYDPDATYRSGMQIRKYLGLRSRFPKNWEHRYASLRKELGLPV